MSTAIVKTSKEVKSATTTVRAHLDAIDRAREIYLATMKRAESEYCDRIKRAATIITGEEPTDSKPPETHAAEQQAASA